MKGALQVIWLFVQVGWALAGLWVSSLGGRREPSIAALFRYADAAHELVTMANRANEQSGLALKTSVLEESAKDARELALMIAVERANRKDLFAAVLEGMR